MIDSTIFTDLVDQVIVATTTQHDLESKLIMIGFQRIGATFNKYIFRDYRLDNHFIRIRLNDNTYDQDYNKFNISTRSEITKHATEEIIQKMIDYDNGKYNQRDGT